MDKNYKKTLNELWKEGQELQKNVLNNLVFEIADFTDVKPGEKIDSNAFFSKQFLRKNEIQDRILNFSVSNNFFFNCKRINSLVTVIFVESVGFLTSLVL